MKKSIPPKLTLLVLMLVAFLSHGCIKDFDEGANFSFRSVEGRIHGSWRLQQVIINGIDSTEIPPYSKYYGHGIVTFTFNRIASNQLGIEASYPNFPTPSTIGVWAYNGGTRLSTYFYRNGGAYDYPTQIITALNLGEMKCCRFDKLAFEVSIDGISHRTVLVR